MLASITTNKVYLILFLIVLFAGILRFYRVTDYPVSLYWDEVSSAYNAYSIANTGKDEFGTPHPLLFRAFEDYKTPANIYLSAFPVKFFGLNEFSARFTSAFLGTLTVLITFFLIKELLGKPVISLTSGFWIGSDYLALLTSFFLSISPWHTQFSRTGFEANTGLFFIVLGSLFLFRFIRRERPLNIYLSSAIFAVSIYFYRSIWIFVPLLILLFLIVYRKVLFAKVNLKNTVIAGLIFLIITVPFAPIMFSKQGLIRARQVNVVDNSTAQTARFISNQQNFQGIVGKIVFNRRVAYAQEVIRGYLSHYSASYLFFQGDGNGRHGVKGVGVMYLYSIILILPGLFVLSKLERKSRWIIITWLLIAPIPAALSVPAPHALRSLNMLPMPQLVQALGFFMIFVHLRKNLRIFFSGALVIIILFFFVRYVFSYYGPNANLTSSEWGDGYKQLTEYVFENEKPYDKIVISGHYWQPYIYFLFYKNYDPAKFQAGGSKKGFDKYLFGGTSWDMNGKELGDQDLKKFANTSNALVALSPVEYNLQKNNLEVVKEIKNHNNEVVFIVGTLK
ncbi:MAG: glycosyltransferase family 39 protein [Patescibacteria group bacterium]